MMYFTHSQAETLYQQNRESTVYSITYPTARAELELNIVALLKAQAEATAGPPGQYCANHNPFKV